MDPALRHRVNAGRMAVQAQTAFFRRQLGAVVSEWKPDDTRVTFADFAISEKVLAALRSSFPEDDVCSGESNPQDEIMALNARYAWVLDPIDGTTNSAGGMPMCGISLALLKGGRPVYGFIYDYARDRIVEGGAGFPLLDGGTKVVPSAPPCTPRTGVLGMHFPLPAEQTLALHDLLSTYRVRSLGSAALNLAYTALGFLDGCVDFKVKVWDLAAGHALMEAAGRQMVYLEASPFPLQQFHAHAPNLPFCAGTPAALELFCTRLQSPTG